MPPTRALVLQELFHWFDAALSQPIPDSTVAFHVNLYEGESSVHVQLMGTESFEPGTNPETDYWPGGPTFSTGEDIFAIPFDVAGAAWPEWLETAKDMVKSYVRSGAKASRLRVSRGVGIGFVDGDMEILWSQAQG